MFLKIYSIIGAEKFKKGNKGRNVLRNGILTKNYYFVSFSNSHMINVEGFYIFIFFELICCKCLIKIITNNYFYNTNYLYKELNVKYCPAVYK